MIYSRQMTDAQPEDDPYFDDCPLCQMQKAADKEGRTLSLEELKAGFEEARARGAMVGGPLLEKDEEEEPRGGETATPKL